MATTSWKTGAAIAIRREADRLQQIALELQELSDQLHDAASSVHIPPIGNSRYKVKLAEDRIREMGVEKLADRLCDVRNIDMTMDYDFTNPRFNSYRRKIED